MSKTAKARQDWTINRIQEAVRATGSHWFDPDTMRFFGTKVLNSTVYQGPGGVYFVTSEWDGFDGKDNNRRAYTVRQFKPDTAGIGTVGNICQYKDADDAVSEAARLAGEGGEVVREQHEPISQSQQFLADCRQHGNPDASGAVTDRIIAESARYHSMTEKLCSDEAFCRQINADGEHPQVVKQRKLITELAKDIGAKGVKFSGDPRGCTVKLVWPDGEANDWAKEGWCVPGA